MSSNTKLNADLKAARKEMLANLPKGSVLVHTLEGVTILSVPAGNVQFISTAVCSPDEQKNRRKVGEFHALRRYNLGQYIPMPAYINATELVDMMGFTHSNEGKAYLDRYYY